MELQIKALADIHPYENNPRHNAGAVQAVAESIRQCGYVAPIVIDENGVILAGHTRFKALESLGREEAEVIVKSGLSEEQKRKYRLLDNKTGELAEWDFDLLQKELDGLDFDTLALDWGIKPDEISGRPLTGGSELDMEDFSDDRFQCQCPKCGFRFDPEKHDV